MYVVSTLMEYTVKGPSSIGLNHCHFAIICFITECAPVCVCMSEKSTCVCALFDMLMNFVLITFTFLHQYWMTWQSIVPPWMAFPWTYSSKLISSLAKILINSQVWTACVYGIWYYNSHRSPISCKSLDLWCQLRIQEHSCKKGTKTHKGSRIVWKLLVFIPVQNLG